MWLLMLMLSGPAQAGKAERAVRKEARAVKRETANLGEAAQLYWDAVRWQDLQTASSFIEDMERRIAWTSRAATANRLRGASVLTVEVGPWLDDEVQRRAVVLVRIDVIGDDQVLRSEVRAQTWYRTEAGWFIEPGEEDGVSTAGPAD